VSLYGQLGNIEITYSLMYLMLVVWIPSHPLRRLTVEDLAQLADQSHYSSRAIEDLNRPLVVSAGVDLLLFRPCYLSCYLSLSLHALMLLVRFQMNERAPDAGWTGPT
jgi:hypothetical protein